MSEQSEILAGLKASGAQVVPWCSGCNAEPASGEITFEVEEGVLMPLPIGKNCLEKVRDRMTAAGLELKEGVDTSEEV